MRFTLRRWSGACRTGDSVDRVSFIYESSSGYITAIESLPWKQPPLLCYGPIMEAVTI